MRFETRRSPYLFIPGLFGAAWVVVAFAQPENNYFLFPMLTAGAMPVSYRLQAGLLLPRRLAAIAAVAGLTNVLLIAVLLAISGRLDGPPTLGIDSPIVDAGVWGLLGAAVAAVLTSLGRSL